VEQSYDGLARMEGSPILSACETIRLGGTLTENSMWVDSFQTHVISVWSKELIKELTCKYSVGSGEDVQGGICFGRLTELDCIRTPNCGYEQKSTELLVLGSLKHICWSCRERIEDETRIEAYNKRIHGMQ